MDGLFGTQLLGGNNQNELLTGLLLAGMMRGNGGIFGGGNDSAGVAAATAATVNNDAILAQLADIKASVPLAESQVQLALAGQMASLTDQISGQTAIWFGNVQSAIKENGWAITQAILRV